MELYEMAQSLDNDEIYYNTDSFAVEATPFATAMFVPNVEDSLTVSSARADTAYEQKLTSHLRIKLAADDPFALSLFDADTTMLNNDSVFLDEFKGFWLKPASSNAGMLSFAMRGANTKIRFYYHEGTKFKQYDFQSISSNPVTIHCTNDYTGSIAGQYISQDGEERNDSLLFLQGLNGLNIEFEIPYPEALQGILINKAELILPIVSLPEDSDDFEPVEQLYVTEVVSDSVMDDIDDIFLAATRYSIDDIGDYFGGVVTDDDDYKCSLSAHLQKMAAGEVKKKIRITPYFKQERPARVVLGGPGNSAQPARLRITYTRY